MSERRYHHGDLRRALVEAGLAILEEAGLEALTLRACAARVGVSHAAPRNHFAGLGGLLAAIKAEGFRRHEAAMRAGMAEATNREGR
ncbi:MAG TPA: TetR/AcrR family transcriptional regulator, partial [Paracoccaceae bacterium]|nr:TetR/AcrR family transcriptional regulator [Paracoccaceae bacterium]